IARGRRWRWTAVRRSISSMSRWWMHSPLLGRRQTVRTSASVGARRCCASSSPPGSSTICMSCRSRSCSAAASGCGTVWRRLRSSTTWRRCRRRAASPISPSLDEGRVRQRWVAGGCRCALTAHALRDWCLISGTGASYIEPGWPWQNPWIESFNARLRDEVLDTELFSSLAEAKLIRIQLQGWRDNRLRERGEVRYLRSCLHRGGGALQGQGWREGGYYPRDFARHEHPKARRGHLEDRAPARGPHNHAPAGRVGDPRVDPPLERTS